MLSLALQNMGCDVRVSNQELNIRDGVIQWKPDLLLLDLVLPGCSGLDLLREFTSLSKRTGREMPVIIISSLGFREVVDQAKSLGAVDFVLKPVDLDSFRIKVMPYIDQEKI